MEAKKQMAKNKKMHRFIESTNIAVEPGTIDSSRTSIV